MTARGTASRFLQSVLRNGVGRYLEFVENGVVDFARKNPAVVVYVSAQSVQTPKVVAEYLNGTVKEENINKKSPEEIGALLKKLSDQSGLDIIRIRKPFHTDSPSIQGQWHPFVNRPPAVGTVRPRGKQPE
ncbi:39S ribosomal protein L43, mitochondrial-like [Scleropages formosus]|uniref:Large ribosomal subunit protein mL43 n=1 Tax=Scleropages formosus TaxID=113540 RepID=A0A0P7UIL6_SCLFO|nr:39S ribosomal protein L43, mitochondrial-like [Scleropages formosus]